MLQVSCSTRVVVIAVAHLCICGAGARAAVYRVGPGEAYATVSAVSDKLSAGDVVEVTGDIADSFVLTADGTHDRPVTVRGVVRVKDGRRLRPRLTITGANDEPGVVVAGNWCILEGLDITGATGSTFASGTAICIAAQNVVIRDCYVHHNTQGVYCMEDSAGDVLLEFCEFDSNGASENPQESPMHAVYLVSTRPGATATIQHCYFHDGTGGALLKSRFPRNVIRYNYFESSYNCAINVVSAFGNKAGVFPQHCDFVGNVVDQGWAPYGAYSLMQLGGDQLLAPGTEGDFNIAHNLFITRAAFQFGFSDPTDLLPGESYAVNIQVHGNVDHVRLYNNVFFERGVAGAVIYERGTVWPEAQRTREFVKRRESPDPTVEGSGNWTSGKARLVPSGLAGGVQGPDPGFVDVVTEDYRPGRNSPLAGSAGAALPPGAVAELTARYEPQRGIPGDLTPEERRQVEHPAIGPFEAADIEPARDAGVKCIMEVESSGTYEAWQLPYAVAARRAEELANKGDWEGGLAAAKACFILCPADSRALNRAINAVTGILAAADPNDRRSLKWALYASYGTGGKDGKVGSDDDPGDALDGIVAWYPPREEGFYQEYDKVMEQRASRCLPWQRDWYEVQKAYARLGGGRIDQAADMLLVTLARTYEWMPSLQGTAARRHLNVIERIRVGMGVVYRARHDTTAGFDTFWEQVSTYAQYGPAGTDGTMNTPDDLKPPPLRP